MEQQGVLSHMTRCHLKLLHLWSFAVSRFLLCWLFINFFYAGRCTIFQLRLLSQLLSVNMRSCILISRLQVPIAIFWPNREREFVFLSIRNLKFCYCGFHPPNK